jgi:hypothetical protein
MEYFPHTSGRRPSCWPNPSGSVTASGTITLTKDDQANLSGAGSAFTGIVFRDQDNALVGSGGVITFSIPPAQTRKYTSTGEGQYSGGFATVVTTTGAVAGTAIFSAFDLVGQLLAEAGVPSALAVPNQAILVDWLGLL